LVIVIPHNIREVFNYEDDFNSSEVVNDLSERANVKFVGVLTDIIRRTSRNGNKYARMNFQDEAGTIDGLFLDSQRAPRLTNYLDSR